MSSYWPGLRFWAPPFRRHWWFDVLVLLKEKPTEGEGDEGNPACWQEGFSFQSCCNESYGPGGNAECWDGMHTYQSCCVPGGSFVPPSDFEDLLARGHTGDTSVLPAILQLLSTGGEDCLVTCDSKDSPISGSMWKSFFEASSISKFMRLQPFPAEGDPWRLWTACCSGPGSIKDHVENLAESCRAGAAALVLAILPSLEKNHGREAALEGYMVASQLSHTLEAEDDCRWKHQTNRASWAHFDWFLSPPSMNMPCRGVRIFVDEREASQDLWANSLACADRGLCFTEVWVHEFLRRAECRVDSAEEADFTYVPIYMSCYDLHVKSSRSPALEALMTSLQQPGPPLLLVFSCEKWKLRGWRKWLQGGTRGYVAAAVEAKPLMNADDVEDTPGSATRSWHCQDCFRFGLDILLPSAVAPAEA
ncbi:unnamed protein product, partial [Effrenium voratum]